MISRVRGMLIEKASDRVVVEAAGVGYELEIPTSVYADLPDPGREVTLLAYLAVREDAMTLFGFLREAERRLFRHLVSVSGVGPRLALNFLSAMRVDDIQRAILAEDDGALTRVSGIGRKTARRVIVDLKAKIEEETGMTGRPVPGAIPVAPGGALAAPSEATEALVSLGFVRRDAWEAVSRVMEAAGEGSAVEELVRLALRELAPVGATTQAPKPRIDVARVDAVVKAARDAGIAGPPRARAKGGPRVRTKHG